MNASFEARPIRPWRKGEKRAIPQRGPLPFGARCDACSGLYKAEGVGFEPRGAKRRRYSSFPVRDGIVSSEQRERL
jgi:hypothetical protein